VRRVQRLTMTVYVVVPPEPIVQIADIEGDHPYGDIRMQAMIHAATEDIDGPSGWLGRSLGPQTLEMISSAFDCGRNFCLPFGPVIEVESIKYLDSTGVEQTVDEADYRVIQNRIWFGSGYSFPSTYCAPDAVKIRYQAGYNGVAVADGGTGNVPELAKEAIITMVQDMLRVASQNFGVRSETVEGVGAFSYLDQDKISVTARKAAQSLLSTLRVYSL